MQKAGECLSLWVCRAECAGAVNIYFPKAKRALRGAMVMPDCTRELLTRQILLQHFCTACLRVWKPPLDIVFCIPCTVFLSSEWTGLKIRILKKSVSLGITLRVIWGNLGCYLIVCYKFTICCGLYLITTHELWLLLPVLGFCCPSGWVFTISTYS